MEKASEERGKKLLTVNVLNGWRLFAKEGKAKDEGKWRRIGETTKEGGGRKEERVLQRERTERALRPRGSDHKFEYIMQRQSSPPLWVHFAEDKVRRGSCLSSNES